MPVKSDRWFKQHQDVITPFVEDQVRIGVVSFGLGSYGYDIRLHNEFKVPTPRSVGTQVVSFGLARWGAAVVDPHDVQRLECELYELIQSNTIVIPSGWCVLGRSLEYFQIPDDVVGIPTGKSTYARCGLLVNMSPFEPGWQGYATISLSNVGPWPIRVHAYEGIAQLMFFDGDERPQVSYADRGGKYQADRDEVNIAVAKVDGDG